jgi:hypothetical protein
MELLSSIRAPSKDPTLEDLESLKPHPYLVQALEALQPPLVLITLQLLNYSDDKMTIQLERVVDVVYDEGDSNYDDELEGPYSSESEESIGPIDSITRNSDFISLY